MDEIPPWMEGIAFRLAEGRAVGLTDARMRHPRFLRLTTVSGFSDQAAVSTTMGRSIAAPIC